MDSQIKYQSGFANHFSSEALKGALPIGQNSPQKAPYGLYTEQLSGTAFTMPRADNFRSWLYRILPSAKHAPFEPLESANLSRLEVTQQSNPNQLRWDKMPFPNEDKDFINSLTTQVINGSAKSQSGAAVHLYACTLSMQDRYFYNSDGDFLIVLQQGELRFKTEFGIIDASPGEIIVIQRGIKFQVELQDDCAYGYICENFGAPFTLPNLGPIGANGLANPRDFQTPVSCYEERQGKFKLINKYDDQLWQADLEHSPLDVVAWHGNYAPYKYDLQRFNTINTVSYDHPDPSIFTVLTSPSATDGMANVDFVIFPPRWMVAEHTFRPPYYHRNMMSEYMGLIYGAYDAKSSDGFTPGGSSLHNCMSGHGPDAKSFTTALNANLKPVKYPDTMAFMFESRYPWQVTELAMDAPWRQKDYQDCWQDLEPLFHE